MVASFFVYPLALTAGWYLVGPVDARARSRSSRWPRGSGSAGGSSRAGVAVAVVHAPQAQPRAARTRRRSARCSCSGRPRALGSARARTRGRRVGWSARGGCVLPRPARGARWVSRGDRPQRPLLERARHRRRSRRSRREHLRRRVGLLLSRGPVAGAARRPRARRVRRRRRSGVGCGGRAPSACSASSRPRRSARAFVVVAVTAYWSEHLQLLAYPATLVAAALIWRVDALFGWRAGAVAATLVAAFACWTTLKADASRDVSPLWTGPAISPGAIALERARDAPPARRPGASTTSCSGRTARAATPRSSTRASICACRYFHLYLFSRDASSSRTRWHVRRASARRSSSSRSASSSRSGTSRGGSGFVQRARRLLEERYDLVETRASGRAGVEAPVGVTRRCRPPVCAPACERPDAGRAGRRVASAPSSSVLRVSPRHRRPGALPRVRAAALRRRPPVPPGADARARAPRARGRAEPHLGRDACLPRSTRSTSTSGGCAGSRHGARGWCTASTARSASTAASTTARTTLIARDQRRARRRHDPRSRASRSRSTSSSGSSCATRW